MKNQKGIVWAPVLIMVAVVVVAGLASYFLIQANKSENSSTNVAVVNQANVNITSNSNNSGIWSGIKITLKLTKDGVTKIITGDANFPFSEDPVLLVQMHNVSDDGKSAEFIVRTGEPGQTSPPWNDSAPFSIKEGESYFYEYKNLNIKAVSISPSNCPEGMQC